MTAMKLLKKLTNPILLTVQGFIAGALLFFATHPEAAGATATRLAATVQLADIR